MARPIAMAFVFLVGLLTLTVVNAADLATPTSNEMPFDCPITQPNGVQPPPSANVFGRGGGDYGNEFLWTSLWMWGDGYIGLPPGDEHIGPDSSFRELKWAWYRFVQGNLTITGQRLDADAPPLVGIVGDGYGSSGFLPTGVTVPSPGCWEVTGTLDTGGSLTFVVEVRVTDRATPIATLT